MIAITSRVNLQERLRQVSARFGMPAPIFLATAGELLESASRVSLLFVDMSACCRDPRAEVCVRTWLEYHPLSDVILYVPLADRECEIRMMFALAKQGIGHVMTASDLERDAVWRTVTERRALATLQAEIQADFQDTAAGLGARIRAESIVLQVLAEAPKVVDVHATAATGLPDVFGSGDTRRKAVWRRLHEAGQVPVSWLLVVFRVLWYAKLVEKGWHAGDIACFLGFNSPRQLRLTVKRRLGLTIDELKQVRYREALDWAAFLCASGAAELSGMTLRTLVRPLLEAARPGLLPAHPAPHYPSLDSGAVA
jgi:hypothetical protein